LIFFISLFILNSCNNNSTKKKDIKSSRVKNNIYFLDSLHLIFEIKKNTSDTDLQKLIVDFYTKRDFEFIWINSSGINEFGKNLFNMLNNQMPSLDSDTLSINKTSNSKLQKVFNSFIDEPEFKNDSIAANLEILLTLKFFEYAQKNWQGIS
jgi:competence protein ComGC